MSNVNWFVPSFIHGQTHPHKKVVENKTFLHKSYHVIQLKKTLETVQRQQTLEAHCGTVHTLEVLQQQPVNQVGSYLHLPLETITLD